MSQQRGLPRKAMGKSTTIVVACYHVGCLLRLIETGVKNVVKVKEVKGAIGEGKGRKRMREGKEIREALKRLKDEHLRRMRQPSSYSPPGLVIMVDTLEWVLGDKKRLPYFA